MITESIKIYFHRVLLILTYIFLAIFIFGALGPFLSIMASFTDIVFGASFVVLLRKIIADNNTKELFNLCFAFAFLDWLLYKSNTQFRINISGIYEIIFNKFKNYLWE